MRAEDLKEMAEKNKVARQTAEAAFDLCCSTAADLDNQQRFWETLGTAVLGKLGYAVTRKVPVELKPMDDEEAAAFENTIVPYGKYQGERVSEVPPTYWIYLSEGDFPKQLARYMKSSWFQKRQE